MTPQHWPLSPVPDPLLPSDLPDGHGGENYEALQFLLCRHEDLLDYRDVEATYDKFASTGEESVSFEKMKKNVMSGAILL